jgi:NADP-dependent 3-hydroxy acid dehydrogenase YdfG
VSNPDEAEAMVARAEEELGPLRIGVNNAGIGGTSQPTGQYDLDAWRRVMSVNLDGVFYCMRAEIGSMSRAGGGSIINMSSVLGSVGIENSPAYVASKHGVVGLTKAAALEHAAEGVRINAVGPGFISTPLLEGNLPAEAQAQIATLHVLGRLGTLGEVANLVAFLASDDASFITGSYHLADGKAVFARMRFGSSKATAPANLVYPSRKAARKIAAPLARKDGSHPMHRATKGAPRECELKHSAKGTESSCFHHTAVAKSTLTNSAFS